MADDYYNMVKNAKLQINRKDYGVLGLWVRFPEGGGLKWSDYIEERYLLVNHQETIDAVRQISCFYTLRPSKQPLDGMHAYPST